jgi:hypothetical protein
VSTLLFCCTTQHGGYPVNFITQNLKHCRDQSCDWRLSVRNKPSAILVTYWQAWLKSTPQLQLSNWPVRGCFVLESTSWK